jgi:hypothetical protein
MLVRLLLSYGTPEKGATDLSHGAAQHTQLGGLPWQTGRHRCQSSPAGLLRGSQQTWQHRSGCEPLCPAVPLQAVYAMCGRFSAHCFEFAEGQKQACVQHMLEFMHFPHFESFTPRDHHYVQISHIL